MPQIGELKVREYELAKAYYCGLCRTLKQEYGKTSILNYDCAFIYLLGESLKEEAQEIVPCKCGLHPIQKRAAVYGSSAQYAACINALMGYAKLADDVRDGSKKARLLKPFFSKMYRRAKEYQPAIHEKMLTMTNRLMALEQQKCNDTDAVAEPYAQLFGNVLMELDVVQSHILYDLGYSLGRWVYLIDAYDDRQEDMEQHNYNVFIEKYGLQKTITEQQKKETEFTFHYTLATAKDALSRLRIKKNKAILENIICLGLRAQTERILEGTTDESIRSSGCK